MAHQSRDYGFDNMKAALIFLVVFGHLLEFCDVWVGGGIYRVIYLFHIPCFFFVSGYFARERPGAFHLGAAIVQYILFQTAYLCFAKFYLDEDISFQYTTPYWHLWFSVSIIFCSVFLCACNLNTTGKRVTAIIASFIVSILAGFDDTVAYYLSLSRTVVFFPYFLLGFCYRKEESRIHSFLQYTPGTRAVFSAGVLLTVAASGIYILFTEMSPRSLYGAFPYSEIPNGLSIRLASTLFALAWLVLLLFLFRRIFFRKIPLVSRIGASTLSIYLFHGFVVRFLEHHHDPILDHYSSVILVTLICLLVLGHPVLSRLLSPRFFGRSQKEHLISK